MRLFIALDFNELKDYFKDLQEKISFEGANLVFPKDFHLTLKFFADVDEEKAKQISKRLLQINFRPFEAKVSGMGFFTEDFLKVIFVGIESKDAMSLQKKIDETLADLFPMEKKFHPHITLARVKHVEEKATFISHLRKVATGGKRAAIRGFLLIKSELTPEGPVYEVLGHYPQ